MPPAKITPARARRPAAVKKPGADVDPVKARRAALRKIAKLEKALLDEAIAPNGEFKGQIANASAVNQLIAIMQLRSRIEGIYTGPPEAPIGNMDDARASMIAKLQALSDGKKKASEAEK